MTRYGAIITAAGQSTRMGKFKPLIETDGRSLVEHIVMRFEEAGVSDISIVAGYRMEDLKAALKGREVAFICNKDFRKNEMIDSVRLGLRYFHGRCKKVFITPVDIPFFQVSTLLSEMKTEAPVVIPEYQGRGGHPILVASEVFDHIQSSDSPNGLKGVLQNLHTGSVTRIPVDDPGCVMDADTPEDLERMLRILRERSGF